MKDLQVASRSEMRDMSTSLCDEGRYMLGDAIWSTENETQIHFSDCRQCHVVAFSVGLVILRRYMMWEVADSAGNN
jgi:hypothetical protein